MRTLLLFRGSPGCGKSTFIKEHNLEKYTLSADNIRLMCQSPVLNIDGTYSISQSNDNVVWDMLFNMLEQRMLRGEFIVVDATNSKTSEMTRYKNIAKQYRYRIICIDITDVPIEVAKERNRNRQPSYKVVPEFVIDNMYARFETQQIPSGIKVIKPNEFEDAIKYTITDLSHYKKIHHIGDIHGCYTVLREYLKEIKEDELYIFLGDYCDRGIENDKVLNFLFEIMNLPNVLLLTGNHERYLQQYGKDIMTQSIQFERYTRPQLDSAGISKKNVRKLYDKLGQIAYYKYNDKEVLVSHGGISCIPNNLLFIATDQMIRGVGKYEDMEYVNDSFIKNTAENVYQIHGHRNINGSPVQVNNRCFCLEGEVEFGGKLRIVTLDKNGFETIELTNEVFEIVEDKKDTNFDDLSNADVIKELRQNQYINEKKFGDISSFNFNKMAFKKGIWNEQTVKARGLYFNTKTNDIVTRSYDKFFNINENELTKLGNLRRIMQFPAVAYLKYNGFLGLIGYDKTTDELIISSKSDINYTYAEIFREIIYNKLDETQLEQMKNFVKENNCSLVFEVISPTKDSHIIEYKENNIVLLNIVYNKLQFRQADYTLVVNFAKSLNLDYKEKVRIFNDWNEFKTWYDEIIKENYKYKNEYIEGFVVEDSNQFMVKIKTNYYKFWKFMRGVVDSVKRRGYILNTSALQTPTANLFYGWLRKQDKETLNEDIITLRNKFYQK